LFISEFTSHFNELESTVIINFVISKIQVEFLKSWDRFMICIFFLRLCLLSFIFLLIFITIFLISVTQPLNRFGNITCAFIFDGVWGNIKIYAENSRVSFYFLKEHFDSNVCYHVLAKIQAQWFQTLQWCHAQAHHLEV